MKNIFGDNSMAYFIHSSLRDEFYFVIIIQAINCLPILVCPYRAKILLNHIPVGLSPWAIDSMSALRFFHKQLHF